MLQFISKFVMFLTPTTCNISAFHTELRWVYTHPKSSSLHQISVYDEKEKYY